MKRFLDSAMRPNRYLKLKVIAGAKVAKMAHTRLVRVQVPAPQPR